MVPTKPNQKPTATAAATAAPAPVAPAAPSRRTRHKRSRVEKLAARLEGLAVAYDRLRAQLAPIQQDDKLDAKCRAAAGKVQHRTTSTAALIRLDVDDLRVVDTFGVDVAKPPKAPAYAVGDKVAIKKSARATYTLAGLYDALDVSELTVAKVSQDGRKFVVGNPARGVSFLVRYAKHLEERK